MKMEDINKLERAKKVYQTLCSAIEQRNWKYDKEEDRLFVHFSVSGDDFPMQFYVFVEVERQLIRLLSPMPFKMSENKRIEGALAACAASCGMIDGSFDYDLSTGEIYFRTTALFRESEIGEDLFQYMISLSCAMVDKYNDKFFAIDKGFLSINDFIAEE